jgi:hypothetical protein
MYIWTPGSKRKKGNRSARYRAKLKAKDRRRKNRVIGRRISAR